MTVPPKIAAWVRWHRVSRKELDAETVDWLAAVALGMLAAIDEKDANRRRALALKAAGITGRASFEQVAIAEAGRTLEGNALRIAAGVITRHLPGTKSEITPEALRKRISRALKK